MKHYAWLLAAVLVSGVAFAKDVVPKEMGSLSEKDFKKLESKVKIGSVSDSKADNQAGDECIVLKIPTTQPEKEAVDREYRIRVYVELIEKTSKKISYTQMSRLRGSVNAEYIGEDFWKFELPVGNLEKPKLSAHVIQYGFMDGEKFVILSEVKKGVESAEALIARAEGSILEQKAEIKHQYSYRGGESVNQTAWN